MAQVAGAVANPYLGAATNLGAAGAGKADGAYPAYPDWYTTIGAAATIGTCACAGAA